MVEAAGDADPAGVALYGECVGRGAAGLLDVVVDLGIEATVEISCFDLGRGGRKILKLNRKSGVVLVGFKTLGARGVEQ